MVYHGRIQNGEIILDDQVRLPEGAAVRVDVIEQRIAGQAPSGGSVFDELRSAVGASTGLPEDAARNVDHYLYGHPRQ